MSYKIYNRRYTGSKYKLKDWICDLIEENCEGDSFCDIFAGTGIISEEMMHKKSRVVINDLLFSNNIIYKAFYKDGVYDKLKLEVCAEKFRSIQSDRINENYFSINFRNTFFSHNDSKIIGEIREQICLMQQALTEKEYNILLASLLYSADKCANTVGHYDAYFKGKEIKDKFKFNLIDPLECKNCIIEVYREDANAIANNINCDIIYIDPPYNSRQYSRFYHVLENLTQWKKPLLFGAALKPEPENMSEYCKSKAPIAFDDLIKKLNCKYIVVSYNNTYESKSSSSKNKISLEFIKKTLLKKGELKVFEKSHQYFNAGKTEFKDHKEIIFIVKVGEA